MSPDVEFLKRISGPPREFDAAEFVNRFVEDEIQHLRHESFHGLFHDYVRENGYPLPEQIIHSSAYQPRKQIEDTLRKSIMAGQNAIILGCEGSGKTTLIHRVAGSVARDTTRPFLYIDASDIDIRSRADFIDTIYDKLTNAIAKNVSKDTEAAFEAWLDQHRQGIFSKTILDTSTPKRLAETFIAYIRTANDDLNYIILDNIDSLSLSAAKEFFSALNLVDETVRSIAKVLSVRDHQNVRYIISCRTPTYEHVSGLSYGLFIHFEHKLIVVDDDFVENTDIIHLLENFVTKEKSHLFSMMRTSVISVNLGGGDQILTFEQYVNIVLEWLKSSGAIFNKTIKMFCGRSIRRAKLFGIKVLASPIIARLALFERYKVVNLVREDRSYLERRLQEAIFDFSRSQGLRLAGFPMNPFRVVNDLDDFRANPLIGLIGIEYLVQNEDELARPDIVFAKTIDVQTLLNYLRKVGYSDIAIKDFFSSCRDCGLLRPIPSSDVLLKDNVDHREVRALYVLDDRARDSYHQLIFAQNARISMLFYNSALRARYGIAADRHLDNITYECFTTLIFLDDLIKREQGLEKMMENSGIMANTVTSRIRSSLVPVLSGILSQPPRPTKLQQDRTMAELTGRADALFRRVRRQMGRQASIM